MDIYSTTVLNRVVETLVPNPMFLLNAFFTSVEVSDTETIMFDKVTGRRRISPMVSPVIQGQVVEDQGFQTDSFAPAYVKDKRVFDPNKAFKRRAGEKIGGSLSPEQRVQAAISFALEDQLTMLGRRLEVMAAEVLFSGKSTIEGEGFPKKVVNFGRDASLNVVLSGADLWSAGTATPIQDLQDWMELVYTASGTVPTDVVMTPDSWVLFKKDPEFKNLIDVLKRSIDESKAVLGPMIVGAKGARLVALFGELRIWVYNDRYIDPLDGVEKPMLAAGSVIMTSTELDGVRHFGAIKDLKAGLQAREFFVKSWEEEDPSVRYLLGQSAPLLVPYRVNATLGAKVV